MDKNNGFNIIGDIAGNKRTLLELMKMMPEGCPFIFVGDMVDRGPDSKGVLELAMERDWRTYKGDEAPIIPIYGNHEDLFYRAVVPELDEGGDPVGQGSSYVWLANGGGATCLSFNPGVKHFRDCIFDQDIIDWLATLPMYYEGDDFFVSHAPVTTSLKNVPPDPFGRDYYFIWNRYEPKKPREKFMFYGHNGKFKVHKWGDGTEYAMCVDNSHRYTMVGVHWPSLEKFELEIIEYREEREKQEEHRKAAEAKEVDDDF